MPVDASQRTRCSVGEAAPRCKLATFRVATRKKVYPGMRNDADRDPGPTNRSSRRRPPGPLPTPPGSVGQAARAVELRPRLSHEHGGRGHRRWRSPGAGGCRTLVGGSPAPPARSSRTAVVRSWSFECRAVRHVRYLLREGRRFCVFVWNGSIFGAHVSTRSKAADATSSNRRMTGGGSEIGPGVGGVGAMRLLRDNRPFRALWCARSISFSATRSAWSSWYA